MTQTPLERSSLQTARLCSFSNLRNNRMITIHCSICLYQQTVIKKPQIMLRTAPNFSNSTNRVSAHSLRHHTSASSIVKWTQLTTLLLQLPVVGKSLRVGCRWQVISHEMDKSVFIYKGIIYLDNGVVASMLQRSCCFWNSYACCFGSRCQSSYHTWQVLGYVGVALFVWDEIQN